MGRWLEVTLTLVLFAIAMAVVGWVVNATVPSFQTWLVKHIGHTALDVALVLFILASAAYSWHGHRKAGAKPKGM